VSWGCLLSEYGCTVIVPGSCWGDSGLAVDTIKGFSVTACQPISHDFFRKSDTRLIGPRSDPKGTVDGGLISSFLPNQPTDFVWK